MKSPLTGGCACGAVRYTCSSEPLVMLNCHCRDCQRVSGGTHASFVVVTAESFQLTQGLPRYHFTESLAMGRQRRGYCGDCGSPLTGGEQAGGGSPIVAIHPASLDHPRAFRPQMNVWTSDALPEARLDVELPNFPFYPPS